MCDTFQLNVDQILRLSWHSNITVESSGDLKLTFWLQKKSPFPLVNIERAVQDDSSRREGLKKLELWWCYESYLTSNYAALSCPFSPFLRYIFQFNISCYRTPFSFSVVEPSYWIVDWVLSILPNHLTVQGRSPLLTV